jgi:NAD(P)-dependent dehydrogenase (short-subunit alcohol dehydrogenase family)
MRAKTILITGATAGIGRFAAMHLLRRGHRVLASGRNAAALAALTTETGALPLETLPLDVTDAASIAAAAAEVQRLTDGRGLDVLVNNAGYGLSGPLEGLTDAALKAQFDTNVFGLLAVTRAFLPAMRARGEGRVVNVASVLGHMSLPFLGAYCATKYALEALTDAPRLELAPFGIQAVLIEPGTIRSEFEERTLSSLAPFRAGSPYAPFIDGFEKEARLFYKLAGRPEQVARAIERAVDARWPRARYRTPLTWRIALAFFRAMPTRVADWMLRLVGGLNRRKLPAPIRRASTKV